MIPCVSVQMSSPTETLLNKHKLNDLVSHRDRFRLLQPFLHAFLTLFSVVVIQPLCRCVTGFAGMVPLRMLDKRN